MFVVLLIIENVEEDTDFYQIFLSTGYQLFGVFTFSLPSPIMLFTFTITVFCWLLNHADTYIHQYAYYDDPHEKCIYCCRVLIMKTHMSCKLRPIIHHCSSPTIPGSQTNNNTFWSYYNMIWYIQMPQISFLLFPTLVSIIQMCCRFFL